MAYIIGKIETKAQFLAMKPIGFACVRCYCIKKVYTNYFRISPIFPKTIAITEIFGKLIIM